MATNNAIDNKAYVFNSDTTITAGTGLTATTGNITASAGAVSASTTVTAGTNLVATAGNLLLPTTTSTVGQIQINSVRFVSSYGTNNTFVGSGSGTTSAAGSNSTALGFAAMDAMGTGGYSVAIGVDALGSWSTNDHNTVVGYNSGLSIVNGQKNCFFGSRSGKNLINGDTNIIIGYPDNSGCGSNYTGGESSNILLNNIGVTGELNTLRIGSATGTSTANLKQAYICGIYTTAAAPSGTAKVILVDSNNLEYGLTNTTGALLHVAAAGTAPIWSTGPKVTDLTLTGTFVLPSTEITADTYNLAINKTYVVNNANMSVCQLPGTAAVGSWIEVIGKSANMWKIESTAAKNIAEGASVTSGAGGKVEATQQYTSIKIKCITADALWVIVSRTGTVTIA